MTIDTALRQAFIDGLNAKFSDSEFMLDKPGRKYTRVASRSKLGGGRMVYCFLDVDNNVLKAAGWAKPAEGVRASLTWESLDSILTVADAHTGWLYKR